MSRTADLACDACAWYLAPGARAKQGDTYCVPCCTHPRLINSHGIIATSIARAAGQLCGPERAFYSAHRINVNGGRR